MFYHVLDFFLDVMTIINVNVCYVVAKSAGNTLVSFILKQASEKVSKIALGLFLTGDKHRHTCRKQ